MSRSPLPLPVAAAVAGFAFAVSEGRTASSSGGKIVNGKSVADFFAPRWKP